MIRKKTVLGIGLVLFAVGAYFFPLGADVLVYLAIQAMGGSYWGGILLTYVWTSSLAIAGLLLIWKPDWFYRPLGLVVLLAALGIAVYLTIFFAAGRF